MDLPGSCRGITSRLRWVRRNTKHGSMSVLPKNGEHRLRVLMVKMRFRDLFASGSFADNIR